VLYASARGAFEVRRPSWNVRKQILVGQITTPSWPLHPPHRPGTGTAISTAIGSMSWPTLWTPNAPQRWPRWVPDWYPIKLRQT
jgi:hypothetical protein